MTVHQLERGNWKVENQYPRVVKKEGNLRAQDLVNKVFEVGDRKWRGVGSIPKSGYKLRYEFRDHDAERIFEVEEIDTKEPDICISGLVLRGVKKPQDCPAFGKQCTPERPLGATMVSAEGNLKERQNASITILALSFRLIIQLAPNSFVVAAIWLSTTAPNLDAGSRVSMYGLIMLAIG